MVSAAVATAQGNPAVLAALIAAAVALVSSVVSAVSSWRSNRNARWQLERRLEHEASQRERDRQLELKRDIYVPAVEAIIHAQSLVGQLVRPEVDNASVSRELMEGLAKIAKIYVV